MHLLADQEDSWMKFFITHLIRTIKSYDKNAKVSGFVCDNIDRLYYSSHKVTLNQGNFYLKTKLWCINKETTVNPKRR